jgi:hypothetical protein
LAWLGAAVCRPPPACTAAEAPRGAAAAHPASTAGGSNHLGDLPQELQQEIAAHPSPAAPQQQGARRCWDGWPVAGSRHCGGGSRLELRVGGVGKEPARKLIRALAALPARITQLGIACETAEAEAAAAPAQAGRVGRQLA